MFTLLRPLTISRLLLEQWPAFIISFIIAEMFYKFHAANDGTNRVQGPCQRIRGNKVSAGFL